MSMRQLPSQDAQAVPVPASVHVPVSMLLASQKRLHAPQVRY